MLATNFSRRAPIQRLMNTGLVVILQEPAEFSFQILRAPQEDAVKVFSPNGSNQSLDEGMRYRAIRDGFDFPDLENPQVGLPSVISEQRIVVRTEIVWSTLRRDGRVEHATQGNTINIARMNAKTADTPHDP
jgi:hypothetical protein